MTQAPATLDEFRAFLNVDANDTVDDEERYGKLLAATETVENRCGAMRVRTVSETVRADSAGMIDVSEGPLVSVTSLTLDGTAVDLSGVDVDTETGILEATGAALSGRYVVVYVVGREPVPEALKEATLLVAEQLWLSQRGPSTTARFSGNAGAEEQNTYKGFVWPRRAEQLAEPYRIATLA